MIPLGGSNKPNDAAPHLAGLSFFIFFAELSLTAFSAHKIKNAPDGASFGL